MKLQSKSRRYSFFFDFKSLDRYILKIESNSISDSSQSKILERDDILTPLLKRAIIEIIKYCASNNIKVQLISYNIYIQV